MTIKRSMPPAGAPNARLLILGSLPGEASLRAQQYYAHPQNQFWRLLGGAIGEELHGLAYDRRIGRLEARGILLWDVVAEAVRQGSLDASIRSASANALDRFVAERPQLRAVAFNGRTAAAIGRRAVGDLHRLRLIDLPSSSPAFTLSLTEKAERWAVLGPLAWPPENATLNR